MTVKRRNYGRNHGYFVDGVKAPGVTTIIGETLPKGALTDWAARCGANEVIDYWDELAELLPSQRHKRVHKAYTHDRDRAARRGTEVHRLAEQLADPDLDVATGEPIPVQVPDELAGHVEAYRDWLDLVQPTVVATELVVANRTERYCGTADLIADLPPMLVAAEIIPAARWLIDLKTSRSGVFPETALQLTGYEHAEHYVHPDKPDDEQPMSLLGIERCGVLWIGSDTTELRPVYTGERAWACFQRLRWLYDLKDEMPGWIGNTAELAGLPMTA